MAGVEARNLLTYSNEMIKCIDEMMMKRDEVNKEIIAEQTEQKALQKDIMTLTTKLSELSVSICKKISVRKEFDKTIAKTEAQYRQLREALFNPLAARDKERERERQRQEKERREKALREENDG